MEILGYIAAILIGLSLGMIGSGGSILTVPVLVYLMKMDPLVATASSLFIVGSTSLVGGLRAYAKNQVNFRAITEFGIPSLFAVFIARHYLLPAIPDTLFYLGNRPVSKASFLMMSFAVIMFGTSLLMIRKKETESTIAAIGKTNINKVLPIVLLGLLVGTVTGLLGAGGGFLIIPSLVFFLRLGMKTAVGTSLFIISINALFGFLFSLKQYDYNWPLILIFTLLAIAGIIIGSRLALKVSGAVLKKSFGWFILIMGIYIITKELALQ